MPASVPTAAEFAALAARVTALEGADADPNPDPGPEPGPPAPSNLTAAAGPDPGSVLLTWSGPATGLRSRSSYDPADHVNDLGPVVGGRSVRTGLPAGTHTWWLVGPGGESNRATFTTSAPPADPEPPAGPGPTPPPAGTTLFAADFESGLGGWAAIQTSPTGHDSSPQPVPGRIELLPRPGGGGTACRVRRPAGDRERTEFLPGDACDVKSGDVRTISLDWLFPADFPTPRGRWFIVYQQHAGGGSPAFAIEVDRSDRLVIRNNRTNDEPTVIGPIDRGVWHRYEIGVRFASDGWVEVRRDGVEVVPRTKRNTAPADYAKVGIYTDHNGHNVTSEVWIDNFRFVRP